MWLFAVCLEVYCLALRTHFPLPAFGLRTLGCLLRILYVFRYYWVARPALQVSVRFCKRVFGIMGHLAFSDGLQWWPAAKLDCWQSCAAQTPQRHSVPQTRACAQIWQLLSDGGASKGLDVSAVILTTQRLPAVFTWFSFWDCICTWFINQMLSI